MVTSVYMVCCVMGLVAMANSEETSVVPGTDASDTSAASTVIQSTTTTVTTTTTTTAKPTTTTSPPTTTQVQTTSQEKSTAGNDVTTEAILMELEEDGVARYAYIMIIVLLGVPVLILIICLIRCYTSSRLKAKPKEPKPIIEPEWVKKRKTDRQKSLLNITDASVTASPSSVVLNGQAKEKRLALLKKRQNTKSNDQKSAPDVYTTYPQDDILYRESLPPPSPPLHHPPRRLPPLKASLCPPLDPECMSIGSNLSIYDPIPPVYG